jgi:hypothetical protein
MRAAACSLRRDGDDRRVQRIGQFFGVGLDQPRRGFEACAQGFAAGVQRDFQAHVVEAQQQRFQPLGIDTTGQTSRHDDGIEIAGNLLDTSRQRLLRLNADLGPRAIQIGDPATAFSQLDIAARLARHPHELVDKAALGKQRFERLLIIDAEKSG